MSIQRPTQQDFQSALRNVPKMFSESISVLTKPGVSTFEEFEKNGTYINAAAYVLVVALVSALIGGLVGLFSGVLGLIFGLIGGFLGPIIGFFVFTYAVYYIGQQIGGGTGRFDEVAYTFALFVVPLSLVATVLAATIILFPLVLVVGIYQIYLGFLAVKSSMNINDTGKAIIVLVLAYIAQFLATMVVGLILP